MPRRMGRSLKPFKRPLLWSGLWMLAIAVVVTLWTLEMARRRNPRNRPGGKVSGAKRRAVREPGGASPNGEARRREPAERPEPPERA